MKAEVSEEIQAAAEVALRGTPPGADRVMQGLYA
jgi:hypothetical protein